MRYRLAVITSHVIQYQDPLFRKLGAHPEIDLTVLFCSRIGAEPYMDWDLGVELRWDLDLLKGYRHRFLHNFSPRRGGGFWNRVNPGVLIALLRERYDALLVMGWGSLTTWLAFAACRALDIPFYISGDASFVEDPPTFRGRVRRAMLRSLFSRTSGFMLMGTMNGDFYRHFGADPERFFLMPYAIDNERFYANSRMGSGERSALRRELGIAEDGFVVLFAGKLTRLKNPIHLVQALARMRFRDRTTVVFMGDGVERHNLEAYVTEHGLSNVRFLGFVNQTRMPRIYGVSDLLVLPSTRDQRGTVVNEAMACGLPVVITDGVGVWGSGDIVRDGENGFVYPVGDVERLAKILDKLAADPDMRSRMGQRSLEIISTWDYQRDVDGVLAALRATVSRPSGRELVTSEQPG